ncbi:uncharacterized protein [Typha angustifolia]|uniref:uncharacterized protein n=1 Tax=Typha angustifolia TaxID=59011 RepID=UPI003C3054DE
MDPMVEEQLDYGEEEYGSSQKLQYQGSGGAIPALMEEEIMGEDDEYDDLYSDVNVGEGFMHSMKKSSPPPFPNGKGGLLDQKSDGNVLSVSHPSGLPSVSLPGVGLEGKDVKSSYVHKETDQRSSGFLPGKGFEQHGSNYLNGISHNGNRVSDIAVESRVGNAGFQGSLSATVPPKIEVEPKFARGLVPLPSESENNGARNPPPMPQTRPAAAVAAAENHLMMNENSRQGMSSVDNNGPTMLFVGELHWWTTDAELETVLSQYGRVKEIKFFDERASGKSKGYCQVEFYDSTAATACKEGMNGYAFNGRQCVVAFASPQSLRQMGAAFTSRNQTQTQSQPQGRRQMNDGTGRGGGTGYQSNDGGRNNGRAGWGRGGQGLPNRGQGGAGSMRGRGAIGAKGMVAGAAGVGASGGPYGHSLPGPVLGPGGMMHPQSMMGMPFDPTYMARGGPYGGFSGPAFPGMMPSFQAMNTIGLPGVAPHVNPAFFGSGLAANGMGMLGNSGMEGPSAGMWNETNMGVWTGDEHGKRARESSYGGDDDASDYGYGEGNHERGGRSNVSREKEKIPNRDWSGNSDRRHRDEREQDWDRSDRERFREEKDGYKDNRSDLDRGNNDDFTRGQPSSRSRSNSMMTQEDHRPRSRDADYGKRRRLPSE